MTFIKDLWQHLDSNIFFEFVHCAVQAYLINERDICCSNKSLVKSQGINKPLLKSHSWLNCKWDWIKVTEVFRWSQNWWYAVSMFYAAMKLDITIDIKLSNSFHVKPYHKFCYQIEIHGMVSPESYSKVRYQIHYQIK